MVMLKDKTKVTQKQTKKKNLPLKLEIIMLMTCFLNTLMLCLISSS